MKKVAKALTKRPTAILLGVLTSPVNIKHFFQQSSLDLQGVTKTIWRQNILVEKKIWTQKQTLKGTENYEKSMKIGENLRILTKIYENLANSTQIYETLRKSTKIYEMPSSRPPGCLAELKQVSSRTRGSLLELKVASSRTQKDIF